MRDIPGDPLTGQLPRTQILLPEAYGPVRNVRPRVTKLSWPQVPDAEAIAFEKLRPGAVVSVRTRRGVRTWLVRTVNRSANGRRYATAMDHRGFCHSFPLSRVISVDTLQRHLALNSAIKLRAIEVQAGE